MGDQTTPHRALIDVEDSLLVAIDVQAAFLEKLPPADRQPLLDRICWLIRVAVCLNVPLIVTAEDVADLGSIDPQVAQALPPGTSIYDKMVYGLSADPAILSAVERTGRKTAILIGLETDVCVAHSAIGLQQHGYQVVVVADATGSPGPAHALGLDRVRGAGALVMATKGLFYEWLRTVERTKQFWAQHGETVGPRPW
jgi:nicotinamidase-related amidase